MKNLSKKNILKIGLVVVIIVVLIILIVMVANKFSNKSYTDWDSFINDYKDSKITLKENNNVYSTEFKVEDNVLKTSDNESILTNVKNVYEVLYNEDYYVYATSMDGKLYYVNNIKLSTESEYELTELGDYKNIISIEAKEDKIVATDINKNEYDLTNNMDTYIGYSK